MHKIHLFFFCLVILGSAATDLPGYSATPLQYCSAGQNDWSDRHTKIESASECASLCDDSLLCVGFNYCDGSSPICADGFEYHQLCVLATFMDCHDRHESNDWTFYEKEVDTPFESTSPSTGPSVSPSTGPSVSPSSRPSASPSVHPSTCPSVRPSTPPSAGPSTFPSTSPTKFPVHNLAAKPAVRGAPNCPGDWLLIGDNCFSAPEKTHEVLKGEAGFPAGSESYCDNKLQGVKAHIQTKEEAEAYVGDVNGGGDPCNPYNKRCGWVLGMPLGYTTTLNDAGDEIWLLNAGWHGDYPAHMNRWFTCVTSKYEDVCGKERDYSECVKSGNVCGDHPFANHHLCEKGCLCPDGLYLTKDDKCVKESDCPVKDDTEVVCDQDAADNWKDLVTRLKSSGLRRRRLDNVDDVFEDLIEMMNDGGILNVNY